MQTHANEAMHDGGSRGWSPWCTCENFGHGMWPTQEPPRRFQTINLHGFTRSPQSDFGWRFICRFWSLVWATLDIFGRPSFDYILFTKYNHEIYFRSNCLGWLHIKGLSSWWISSKNPILSSVISMVTPTWCHWATWGNPFAGDHYVICLWHMRGSPKKNFLTWRGCASPIVGYAH